MMYGREKRRAESRNRVQAQALLAKGSSETRAMKTSRSSQSTTKLAKLIHGIQFAMLTTVVRGSTLRSRPMATQKTPFDGTLWFFTDDNSAKAHEIGRDKHVNLSYADPDANRYVSISGRATLVKDETRMRKLWNPIYKAWFPKGLDDPHITLLKVTVDQAEYWDSPTSKVVQLFGFIKAAVTGKKADTMVDHRKLRMRGKRRATARRRSAPASRR